MLISEYINLKFGGNKAAFARHMDVDAQAVNKWIKAGWIYFNGWAYSPRREVP